MRAAPGPEGVEHLGEGRFALAVHGDVDVGVLAEELLDVAVVLRRVGPPWIVMLAGFACLTSAESARFRSCDQM